MPYPETDYLYCHGCECRRTHGSDLKCKVCKTKREKP